MKLFKWVDKGIKRMKWYDISLVKLAVLAMTLFLVTAWPAFRNLALSIHWAWYLTTALILSALSARKLFK